MTGIANNGFTGTQETATTITYAPGVYNEIPLKGMIIWNSHAFNLTDENGKVEAWINLYFAPPEEQLYPVTQIFVADPPILFKMNVPPFQAEEVCNIFTPPPNAAAVRAQLAHARARQALAHVRRRLAMSGRRERRRRLLAVRARRRLRDHRSVRRRAVHVAPAAQATATATPTWTVTIDELILGVNIVLGAAAIDECPRLDVNDTGSVDIANLVGAVASASQAGVARPAGEPPLHQLHLQRSARPAVRSADADGRLERARRGALAHLLRALRQRLQRSRPR